MDNKSESKIESVIQRILEKRWNAYTIVEERRRKAFYYLFSTLSLFALLWMANSDKFKIPFLQTDVDQFLAFSLAPIFISLLTAGYFTLCAYSMKTYVEFLETFQKFYFNELNKLDYSFSKLYSSFKIHDLSGSFNPFLFPRKMNIKPSTKLESILDLLATFLANFLLMITTVVPIMFFLVTMYWFYKNYSQHISYTLGVSILAFYTLIGIALLILPVYLYYKIKDARAEFRKEYYRLE